MLSPRIRSPTWMKKHCILCVFQEFLNNAKSNNQKPYLDEETLYIVCLSGVFK